MERELRHRFEFPLILPLEVRGIEGVMSLTKRNKEH